MNTLTYDNLCKTIAEMDKVLGSRPGPDPFSVGSLFGMQIIETTQKPIPKMQLSDDCPVTDDFRKEMNAWLIEFFGYREPIIPLDTIYMAGNRLIMRPETVVKIQNCI